MLLYLRNISSTYAWLSIFMANVLFQASIFFCLVHGNGLPHLVFLPPASSHCSPICLPHVHLGHLIPRTNRLMPSFGLKNSVGFHSLFSQPDINLHFQLYCPCITNTNSRLQSQSVALFPQSQVISCSAPLPLSTYLHVMPAAAFSTQLKCSYFCKAFPKYFSTWFFINTFPHKF